jgi:hypothetical protein
MVSLEHVVVIEAVECQPPYAGRFNIELTVTTGHTLTWNRTPYNQAQLTEAMADIQRSVYLSNDH